MNLALAKMAVSFLLRKPKPVLTHLKRHFGRSPAKFPIVRATFARYRHPCVALAIQNYLKVAGRRGALIGTSTYDSDLTFSDLMHPDKYLQQLEGPVQYRDVTLSNGRSMSFIAQGLHLIAGHGHRLAVFITQGTRYDESVTVEVIAKDRIIAERFISEIRRLADSHSIYRGRVLTIKEDVHQSVGVEFRTVPSIERNQVILPGDILEQIDKHTSRFSQHHELLVARGIHLKRGLLLYGPPGTGKTLTMMYIVSSMAGRTTVVLNGSAVRYLEDACALARSLQPATIVIDDVDLVAGDRSYGNSNSVLFELLNQMDGVAEDSDILFLLGTNRPEVLEPALASRPGRVDRAILIPLPDQDCRLRLFNFYGKNIPLALADSQKLVDATRGASGAFIRELFRQAVLLAADQGPDVCIKDHHLEEALKTLRAGGPFVDKLLAYHDCAE